MVRCLSEKLGISTVTATVLVGRGLCDPEQVNDFLSPSFARMPDPGLMRDMDRAVDRLCLARNRGEQVCVYGDYDVDGITGTALLVSFLRRVGIRCEYFIPNRFDDGYGLSRDALDRIVAQGATLIVSVDCGITAVAEARHCRDQGVDLIIVDHHAPKEDLPQACAVLNPLRSDCSYPCKILAGVGVAFNLLVALRSSLRREGCFADTSEPDIREWLDLVALGTIADVVPLREENRTYVAHGLRRLSATPRPGIRALMRCAGITGTVSAGQVGFRLAPRLNAAGRMESAVPGVDLLLTGDDALATILAEELSAANAERQAVEQRILEEAITMVEQEGTYPARRSIVLASDQWHQGVIGIVASRLVERYHRPTILIACDGEGQGKGSGRSIPGFHLLDAIRVAGVHLDRFGGHRYAAGIGLASDRSAAFAQAFEAEASRQLAESDLQPVLSIDAQIDVDNLTPELVAELKQLEPLGAGNPEPLLLLTGVTVVSQRIVGDKHLKLQLRKQGRTFDAIGFGLGGRTIDSRIDVVCYPEMNVWNGSATLQLKLKDIRPAT